MSKIENSINILGTIAPLNTEDTYPTHWAKYGKGGYVSVPNKEDIPVSRLENGMRIYETSTGGEWTVREESPGAYTFDQYAPSGGVINRQATVLTITEDIELDSSSSYFQFLNPDREDEGPRVILPSPLPLEYFEFEIVNTSETNSLRICELDSNSLVEVILSLGRSETTNYRAVYCAWNGVEWAIWIRAFYQP